MKGYGVSLRKKAARMNRRKNTLVILSSASSERLDCFTASAGQPGGEGASLVIWKKEKKTKKLDLHSAHIQFSVQMTSSALQRKASGVRGSHPPPPRLNPSQAWCEADRASRMAPDCTCAGGFPALPPLCFTHLHRTLRPQHSLLLRGFQSGGLQVLRDKDSTLTNGHF